MKIVIPIAVVSIASLTGAAFALGRYTARGRRGAAGTALPGNPRAQPADEQALLHPPAAMADAAAAATSQPRSRRSTAQTIEPNPARVPRFQSKERLDWKHFSKDLGNLDDPSPPSRIRPASASSTPARRDDRSA